MGIDINTNKQLTVTGGLPYFGGPGNNYVTHSISEIMNRVRLNPKSKGLVTANGNYITKQSIGIYSSEEPMKPFLLKDPNLYQNNINKFKGPTVITNPNGNASIETYTIINDRKGPSFSIVFGRMDNGNRFIANTIKSNQLLSSMMTNDYLGAKGKVISNNGLNIFIPN